MPSHTCHRTHATDALPTGLALCACDSVTLMHKTSTDQSLTQDSGNIFRVRWAGGVYPNAEDRTCEDGCTAVGLQSCICNTVVETTTVFSEMANLPSPEEVEAELHVGSAPPDAFAAGVYTLCATAECNVARGGGVSIFLHSGSAGSLDQRSIFFIHLNRTLGTSRPTYFANKAAVVRVAGGRFAFRNPPKFHSFIRPSIRDAEHETDALIDHLFWHKNVAPFMATKLIQRFTSSNPSPRYVRAVVEGFRSGAHGGRTFSGAYGDLGATFAAILLDREARSTTLDADPTHGQLREPLLKLFHVMRSFDFGDPEARYDHFHFDVSGSIGQHHMHSPTVFNFYDPLYQPEGPVAETGLVAPEAELGTGPFVVGFLNTATSLIRGVWSQGTLLWRAGVDLTNATAVVSELDLLLTGGRLNTHAHSLIAADYRAKLSTSTAAEALQAAQELFLFTAEFHTTNLLNRRKLPRPNIPDIPSQGRAYKAIVYIFLDGGADTYNLLVPTSGCTGGEGTDLWAQWEGQRGDNAIPASQLLKISADVREQPCRSAARARPTPILGLNEGPLPFLAVRAAPREAHSHFRPTPRPMRGAIIRLSYVIAACHHTAAARDPARDPASSLDPAALSASCHD